MISTQNLELLPDSEVLKSTCKAISVLDAILSPEWEFRYYSFNAKWHSEEQCMQMRNGQGDEMHVLFKNNGTVINGFAHEYTQPSKKIITANLPETFNEFIFGEPINSVGTTFCLWELNSDGWVAGKNVTEDNSAEMLRIFDANPATYCNWAGEYYEIDSLPLPTIRQIYKGELLTNEMVLLINSNFDNWEKLVIDLEEIDYPHTIARIEKSGKLNRFRFW